MLVFPFECYFEGIRDITASPLRIAPQAIAIFKLMFTRKKSH